MTGDRFEKLGHGRAGGRARFVGSGGTGGQMGRMAGVGGLCQLTVPTRDRDTRWCCRIAHGITLGPKRGAAGGSLIGGAFSMSQAGGTVSWDHCTGFPRETRGSLKAMSISLNHGFGAAP